MQMRTGLNNRDLSKIVLDIEQNLPKLCEYFKIPGFALQIFQKEGLSRTFCYGYSNIAMQVKVKEDTIFRIASITKLFTAIGICQLWEQGKVDFDKDINEYLKNVIPPIQYRDGTIPITLRHLLTHTSGIGELQRYSDLFRPGFNINVYGNREIPQLSWFYRYGIFTNIPPGSKYAYSNIGMGLVGLIIEVLSGMRYRDYCKKYILDPLDMSSTDFLPNTDLAPRMAQGYLDNSIKGKFKPVKPMQTGIIPAGNGYSTIRDLSILAQCILNGGEYQGKRILKPETIEMMIKPWFQLDSRMEAMGCAFFLEKIGDYTLISHNGATSGFMSALLIIKELNISMVSLSNIDEIFANHGTIRLQNLFAQRILGITESPITPALQAELESDQNNKKKNKKKINQKDPKKGEIEEEEEEEGIDFSALEIIKTYEMEHHLIKTKNDISTKNEENTQIYNNLKKYCGYYRPAKGILTNTRVYMMGFQFKVSVKNNQLFLSTLKKMGRNAVQLHRFSELDPNYFYYKYKRQGASISQIEKIIFTENQNNQIDSLIIDKLKLYKVGFLGSINGIVLKWILMICFLGYLLSLIL
jgi:CubicO group peptidase (beta-lactamase class C family)